MSDPAPDPVNRAFLDAREGLLAFARSQLRDAGEAEDLVQEVWVELAGAIASGRAPEDPGAWCRTVARNRVVDRWRRRGRAPDMVDIRILDRAAAAAVRETADPLRERRLEALRGCLARLTDRPRRLIDLCYRDGLDAAAAALRTGSTAAAVLMALSRARRTLAGCIDRHLRGAAP